MATTYRQKTLDETINPAWRDELLLSLARWAFGAELPPGLELRVELVEFGHLRPRPYARVGLSKLVEGPGGEPVEIQSYGRIVGQHEL